MRFTPPPVCPPATSSTVLSATGGNTGYTPIPYKWHHAVYTYNGAGTEQIYLDGVSQYLMLARSLNILKPSIDGNFNVFLGAWYDGSSSAGSLTQRTFYMGGAFGLGAMRVHNGTLSAAAVVNNYNAESPIYNGNPYEGACPASFTPASVTHSLRYVSWSMFGVTTPVYFRHCRWAAPAETSALRLLSLVWQ
jgi:hypothetical protein